MDVHLKRRNYKDNSYNLGNDKKNELYYVSFC